MAGAATPMATPELLARLRRHYIKPGDMPGGVFIEECGRNGHTGGRVDALHVGFTSSSGRILTGHELKVSRADWLHELNKPVKADLWSDDCHAWYLVTSTPDIVQPGELPAGWGHMVPGPSKTRMKVLVKAEIRADRNPSWDTMRSILARLDTLQRIDRADYRLSIGEKIRTEAREAAELNARSADQVQLEHLQRLVGRLEDALGCEIADWDHHENKVSPATLAAAIRLLKARRTAFANNRSQSVNRFLIKDLHTLAANLTELIDAEAAMSELAPR